MLVTKDTDAAPAKQDPANEQFNYAYSRETYSLERLKAELGYARAVAYEVDMRGYAQLQTQSREALAQMNSILVALGKPEIFAWPTEPRSECEGCGANVPASHIKATGYYDSFNEFDVDGPSCCRTCRRTDEIEEPSEWTPVDEALNTPIFTQGDFFYFHLPTSADALQLAERVGGCDVVDLETDRPMTTNEAARRLDDPRYGEFEKFGVAFPETLNLFITDFVAGLYPALSEAKCTSNE